MDDITSLISDWEEPASQPDLSTISDTKDSTFAPPAEEESRLESNEEEPEVETRQRRQKRKKTGVWWTRRGVEDDAATGGGWAAQVDEVEEGGNVGGDEGDEVEEGVEEVGDNGSFELKSGWYYLKFRILRREMQM